jgi:Tol biopolymer transport system component/tRNA A-37 threonylcarbamoyl transferase component Bud32
MADLLERLRSALADRYAVESEIGRGGMATVFLAEDLKHDRKVAIKVLHPELSVTLAADRFLSEIKIVAGLNHPHILTLHDSGDADGLLYYVMPYVAGESLRHRLEREDQLPVEESVRIAVEVADGLQHAHEQGVIHRDVKPGNILLSGKHAVITDFGIARAITVAQGERVTSTGLGVGTPLYASPEQVMGAETLDGRTDVYSLGCVLYEMLSGQVPLAASTPQAVQARRMSEMPGPIHELRDTVPPLLDQVIAKTLTRLPADRWESAETFAQALLTATMDATPVARLDLATTPGLEAIAAGGPKRKPVRWAIGAGVVAVAAVGAWLVAPWVSSLTGGGEQSAGPPADAMATETKIPLEGWFGDEMGTGTGPFAISPNGEQLAYCSYDDEADAGRLWLADLTSLERAHTPLAGTDEVCSWIRWAPKGDRVTFVETIRGSFGNYVVETNGGLPRPFIDCPIMDSTGEHVGFDPRFTALSPDESLTVYTEEWGFRVLPTGSCDFAEADSVHTGTPNIVPQWSPDGESILYAIEDSFVAIRIDGSGRQALLSQPWAKWPVVWPASAGSIFYHIDGQVMRVPVSRSGIPRGEPEAVAGSEENPVGSFSVSADGQRVVLVRKSNRFRIVRLVPDVSQDPAGVEIVPVTETIQGFGAFGVSHDGQWVAYGQATEDKQDIFKVPADGGEAVRLTRSGNVLLSNWPAWSPDDQFIAYPGFWQDTDTLRLWMVSADGMSNGRVLGVTPHRLTHLSWEGPYLLHSRSDARVEVLTQLEPEYGQWIAQEWVPAPQGSRGGANFVVRANRRLLLDTLAYRWSLFPFVSPDGSRTLAVAATMDFANYWLEVSLTDSDVTPLMQADRVNRPLGWSEDGRSLYWKSGRDLYRWHLEEDEKELLVTLPEGQKWIDRNPDQPGAFCQPRPGTDPLEFVCAIDESVTELFLVEDIDPLVN